MSVESTLLIFLSTAAFYIFIILHKVHALLFLQFKRDPYKEYFGYFFKNFFITVRSIPNYLLFKNKNEWPILADTKVKKLIDLETHVLTLLNPFMAASIVVIFIEVWINSEIAYDQLQVTLGVVASYLNAINKYGLNVFKDYFPLMWVLGFSLPISLGLLKFKIQRMEKLKKIGAFSLSFLVYFSGVSFFGAFTGQSVSKMEGEWKKLKIEIEKVHGDIFDLAKDILITEIKIELVNNYDHKTSKIIEEAIYEFEYKSWEYDSLYKNEIQEFLTPEDFDLYKEYDEQDDADNYSKPYYQLIQVFKEKYDYRTNMERLSRFHQANLNFYEEIGEVKWTEDYFGNPEEWNKSTGNEIKTRLEVVRQAQKDRADGLKGSQKKIFTSISNESIELFICKGHDYLKTIVPESYILSYQLFIEPIFNFISTQGLKKLLDKVMGLKVNANGRLPKLVVLDGSLNLDIFYGDRSRLQEAYERIKKITGIKIRLGKKRRQKQLAEQKKIAEEIKKQRRLNQIDQLKRLEEEFQEKWSQLTSEKSFKVDNFWLDELKNNVFPDIGGSIESRILRYKELNKLYGDLTSVDLCDIRCPRCGLSVCLLICPSLRRW